MAKTDTLFMTKTAENPTLWCLTYLYSPYYGETPPDRAEAIDGSGNVVLMLCSVRKTICGYVNLAYAPHFSLKKKTKDAPTSSPFVQNSHMTSKKKKSQMLQ